MIDRKIDEKETLELKKIYNHYLDKRKKIMKNNSFKDVFGDVISQDKFSQEQITKLNIFLPKIMWVQIETSILIFFINRTGKIKNTEPCAPPAYEKNLVI